MKHMNIFYRLQFFVKNMQRSFCGHEKFRAYEKLLAAFAIAGLGFASNAHAQSSQSIIVLVNDIPISAYDVNQRVKLDLLGSPELRKRFQAKLKDPSTQNAFRQYVIENRPQSREEVTELQKKFVAGIRKRIAASVKRSLRKQVIEKLIDERLLIQNAKKNNIVISDAQVTQRITAIAARNKNPRTGKPQTYKEFLGQLKKLGVSQKTFRERIRASMALQGVIFRKYGRQISIGASQVDRFLASSGDTNSGGKTSVEFNLQRVTIKLPNGGNQKALAQKLIQAEQIRSKFNSCKTTSLLIKGVADADIQNLGARKASQIKQPARSALLRAQVGQMTPPNLAKGVIELYGVCGRKVVAADTKKRKIAQSKLRQQEMQVFRKRYMRDLRQDAFIEYR